MLGYYNYTVILTYLGLLTGFCGITLTADGHIAGAVICLIIAGVCDMFDGKIASTRERTRQEKRFGVQIDSLSDLVCFGVLPAMLVYGSSGGGAILMLPCAFYVLCALIRLAWFNVDEEQRQDRESGSRRYYLGLPVTTAAAAIPLAMGLRSLLPSRSLWIGVLTLIVTAAAFLTPFRLKKPSLSVKREMGVLSCAEVREFTEYTTAELRESQ